MTAYEQGFLTKCAEYGVDGRLLLKQAQAKWNRTGLGGAIGGTAGAIYGAVTSKKRNLRAALKNALKYGLIGGGIGALGGYASTWLGRKPAASATSAHTPTTADSVRNANQVISTINDAVERGDMTREEGQMAIEKQRQEVRENPAVTSDILAGNRETTKAWDEGNHEVIDENGKKVLTDANTAARHYRRNFRIPGDDDGQYDED